VAPQAPRVRVAESWAKDGSRWGEPSSPRSRSPQPAAVSSHRGQPVPIRRVTGISKPDASAPAWRGRTCCQRRGCGRRRNRRNVRRAVSVPRCSQRRAGFVLCVVTSSAADRSRPRRRSGRVPRRAHRPRTRSPARLRHRRAAGRVARRHCDRSARTARTRGRPLSRRRIGMRDTGSA
jgi:hypothetical protein